jgi:hypothetical protein
VLNEVMLLLRSFTFQLTDQQYGEQVLLTLQMPLDDYRKMEDALKVSAFGYQVTADVIK